LAKATETSLNGFFSSKSMSLTANGAVLFHTWRFTAVAPATSKRRRYLPPCFEMAPRRVLPPVECCIGVCHSKAANCRPDRNWSGSVTVAAIAVAVITPS
jgi:hypothetical protein